VQLGLHLNNRYDWTTAEMIVSTAEQAEALGFDAVWVADHVAMPAQVDSPDSTGIVGRWDPLARRTWWESLTVLAHVAGRTRTVRLGVGVMVLAQRQPLLLAKQCATLDALSGGRLVLGAGVGWMREEYAALGAETFDRRGQATDEAIRILRAAWSTDERCAFAGQLFHFEPVQLFPKPARPGGPPIWIGGLGPRALRRVAELGDGWYAEKLSPAALGQRLALLRGLLVAAGRRPEEVAISISLELFPPGVTPSERFGGELFGSAAERAGRLAEYAASGVQHATLVPRGDSWAANQETIQQFTRDVRPLLEPT
jgi:probable F420-dependent oxidoreductase